MATPAPTLGGWAWQPAHSLYYNSLTQIWAAPQPDGSWHYSDPVASTSRATLDPPPQTRADPRPMPDAYEDIEDGELPGGDAGLPVPVPVPRPRARSPAPVPVPAEPVPLLRLVVCGSGILPEQQKVVVVDAARPLVLGRDRTFERRVRLKEMAVSKTHASVFWAGRGAGEEGEWAVTDHGSTQGTWLGRGGREARLSEAKVASAPVAVHHKDTLRLGTTTFSVHIHPSLACAACALAPDSSNLLPLAEPIAPTATPPVGLTTHTPTREERSTAVRSKMRDLRQHILRPNTSSSPARAPAPSPAPAPPLAAKFVDRAAARRARGGPEPAPVSGGGKPTAPPVKASSNPFFSVPGASAYSTAAAATTNAPPAPAADPFAPASRGALLLAKLSGPAASAPPAACSSTPPAASTVPPGGLGRLVQARTFGQVGREERPGLGSRPMRVVGAPAEASAAGYGAGGASEKRGWRDDVREMNRKRFRDMDAV